MRVGARFHVVFDAKLYLPLGLRLPKARNDGMSKRADVDDFLANFRARHAREVQEVVDQHSHSLGCGPRSEEHTSELQSHLNLVCRLLLEKKKKKNTDQLFNKKQKRSEKN